MSTILITRSTDDLCTQSYDLWAQVGRYPLQEGDGEYIGNVAIEPNASTATTTWVAPDTRTWFAIAIPIRFDARGRPTRVTNL